MLKSSLVADGTNPITKSFKLGKQVASAGPEMVWKIYDATRLSNNQVSGLLFICDWNISWIFVCTYLFFRCTISEYQMLWWSYMDALVQDCCKSIVMDGLVQDCCKSIVMDGLVQDCCKSIVMDGLVQDCCKSIVINGLVQDCCKSIVNALVTTDLH